ncbi:hypothetical protein AA101099_2079 [Neoasaia chiangmaiensis NBRC 101099]|nr:hypothetical protein AA101099_2079 [Neoasaia chiangmaiensis NBRC 101099]GEN13933.1 hypothetical protein NCH01_03640 [Neoasaia chiangmaiensis]
MCNINYNNHEKNCNEIYHDNNINLWEMGKRKGMHTEKSSLRSELIRKRLHLMEKIEKRIEKK